MAKRVPTMREMADALALLGFAGPAVRRDHVVFVHPASDTLVILPKLRPNQSVGQARVAAIRLSLIGREVATPEQFDDALNGVHA